MEIRKDVELEIVPAHIVIKDPTNDLPLMIDVGFLGLKPDSPRYPYFRYGERGKRVTLDFIFDWQKIETRTKYLPYGKDAFPALELNFRNQPHIKVTLPNVNYVENRSSSSIKETVEALNYLKDILKYTIADKSQHTVSDIEWLDEFFSGLTPGY